MTYYEWQEKSVRERTELLKFWIRELIDLNKNIANPPSSLYNNVRRRKILKSYIREVSKYMRENYIPEEPDYDKSIPNPRRNRAT
jgi:hypothetical protein